MNEQQQTLAHLQLLAGEHPAGRYLELRSGPRGGAMRRTAIPASQPQRAARMITCLARARDVYIGAALRTTPEHGGASAIEASHLLWIETDDPAAGVRLRRFEHPPSLLAASSPGHLHAYWQLTEPIAPGPARSRQPKARPPPRRRSGVRRPHPSASPLRQPEPQARPAGQRAAARPPSRRPL